MLLLGGGAFSEIEIFYHIPLYSGFVMLLCCGPLKGLHGLFGLYGHGLID
jgi:hypothetical protein